MWYAQEERGFPDINIITEKIAFQGITRFEDRGRMPLGSVFNITSFSARILSQAIYNPRVRPAEAFQPSVRSGAAVQSMGSVITSNIWCPDALLQQV